jgi:hypothetical protein
VAFCGELPPARRLELFERRRSFLAGQLAGTRADRRRRPRERLDPYVRSLRDHDIAAIGHDIAWLDRLIADERAAVDTSSAAARPDAPVAPAQEDTPR